MENLLRESAMLIERIDTDFQRYMFERINWNSRMLGLVGPRGVGKTMMLLQYAKLHLKSNETLYVSADSLHFANNNLVDLAQQMSLNGMRHLLIDEIHKCSNWSSQLKHIYDFYPDLQVIFTGSSVLDILDGQADLSRRAPIYFMQGLSFREYLYLFHKITTPVISIEDIINHKVSIEGVDHPYPYFQDYLRRGYYPFGRDEDFSIRLNQVVNLTMQIDIPRYANMSVALGVKLERLLVIIAQSVPFKPSLPKLAELTGAGRNNMADYLLYLEKAGMIAQLRTEKGGIRSLGKVDKIYLDNTNLAYLLGGNATDTGNIRETFFFNQLRVGHEITMHPKADFTLDDRLVFEVGGRGKQQHQISNTAEAYIVKDDIEKGYMNVLPLWTFGLMY